MSYRTEADKTAYRAIRQHCLLCMNGQVKLVRECYETDCPAHPLRMGKKVSGYQPLEVIRNMCLECVETPEDVAECNPDLLTGDVCPLHRFRFGRGGYKKK